MLEPFRMLAKNEEYVSEEAAGRYGGWSRFWRKNTDGKFKMVFGLNVSGERRNTPNGQVDLWIPTPTLAQVLAIPEQQVKDLLKKLPVLEMKTSDYIVRLENQQAADMVSTSLKNLV